MGCFIALLQRITIKASNFTVQLVCRTEQAAYMILMMILNTKVGGIYAELIFIEIF